MQTFLDALGQLLPPEALLTAPSECSAYGYDNSRRQAQPLAVVLPQDSHQVKGILKLCQQHQIPITPRGKGTGTAGGAVPVTGGIVLSSERMNRILLVDADNRRMRVEPGVTNREVQQAAAEQGFFWAPDPTSNAVCTVGGNIACNAAGPRAVKYGSTRDSILALKGVTAAGEPFSCGVQTTKGVVGYDLTRLLIGSEGTLAVITEATLKLTPLPEARSTLQALYSSMEGAARAVARIMAQPTTPCALEFMDAKALELIRTQGTVELPTQARALLMIEVDGDKERLGTDVEKIITIARDEMDCLQVTAAENAEQEQQLWALRKALSPTLRHIAPKKINEDVVVPVSHMPALIQGLESLSEKHQITIVNFGHAGNGNIHVNLLVDPDNARQMQAAEQCLQEVFDLVLKLEGSLSGEHGIGMVKRDYVSQETDPVALALMQGIKQQFDPQGILNPGKKIPV